MWVCDTSEGGEVSVGGGDANGRYSLSRMMMQMRMEMMAPVPRPAAATAPRVVQSPFSSQGHTFTLMTDLLDNGGFPESDTITGTSYTPGSK